MSQENLKFDNDSDDDGTRGNEMTVGVMNKFGDIGADDDDQGGHNHTQYDGPNGYSQVDGNESCGDTVSQISNQMEENRLQTLKDSPI